MNKKIASGLLRQTLKKFIRNNHGASAVIVAFLAIPLFGAVGLSVDLGRAYVLKGKLSTALDAAGLAVGRNIFSPNSEIYADAQKYFDANFPPGFMGTAAITMNASTVSWDATRQNITLNVRADMGTTFMNVLGQPELTVGASTQIKRDNRGMELVLVLDNTGSMDYSLGGSTRMAELKSASHNLIQILYGDEETQDKLWVGIVPYNVTVNIGPQNINFLSNADRNNILSNSSSIYTQDSDNTALGRDVTGDGISDTVYGWRGCVEMRDDLIDGTVDVSDDPPAKDFVPYFGNDHSTNNWITTTTKWGNTTTSYSINDTKGPNYNCPLTSVLPLTAERSTIDAHIDDMTAQGNTAVNIGMVWGWRAVSPRWNGLWYGSSTLNMPTNTKVSPQVPYTTLPLNYNETYMDKVVILMTDGDNTIGSSRYNAYARQKKKGVSQPYGSLYDGTTGFMRSDRPTYSKDGYSNYAAISDAKVLATCAAMKSAGIIIYTILLVDGNSSMMKSCATSPKHAFVALSADDLEDHFNTIGEELSNLRISK
ncbi:pilus assembly protein TadG-related protein [Sneathiella sp.]|uniref:TadE/TadG family type IV pilus assembly protein n=1 Tax=Sneathiella sp. TaxID=1964365 RepID=UPI003566FFA3